MSNGGHTMFKFKLFKQSFLKGRLSLLDGATVVQVMKQETIEKSARSSQGYLNISGNSEDSVAEDQAANVSSLHNATVQGEGGFKTSLPKDLINLNDHLTCEGPVTKPTLVDDSSVEATEKSSVSFRKGDILKHRSGGGPDIWYMGDGKGEFFTSNGDLGRVDVDDERFDFTGMNNQHYPNKI